MAVLVAEATPVWAQQAGNASEGAAQSEQISSIDDIVVTGTRRASRLQDVPATITALSEERLAAANFTQASDLQYMAPSVSYNPVSGAGFIVRGFGTQGYDYNLEKAVAVVVDDVVQGVPRSVGFNKLTDVERIEVLDGPQGTLFGKNASAGVIFVVTRKPEIGKTSVEGNVRYGTDNEFGLENTLNLPVTDTMAVRLNSVFQRRDGFLRNRFDNFKGGGFRDYSVRGKLLWAPTTELEVYLIGEIQDQHSDGNGLLETVRSYNEPASIPAGSSSQLNYNAQLLPYGIKYGPSNEEYVNDFRAYSALRQTGFQGAITYKLGDYTLTSITAYKHVKSDVGSDGDHTASRFASFVMTDFKSHQFSQEVRLNSPTGGFLDYVVGAYFWDQNVKAKEIQAGTRGQTNLPQTSPATYYGVCCGVSAYPTRQNSLAVFGQANLNLTDDLTAFVGGRFTHDKAAAAYYQTTDSRINVIPLGNARFPTATAGSVGKDDFSAKVGLRYKINRDVMIYAGYSQGYKGPAVGTVRGTLTPVKNESVDAYEIGLKSQFLDRRITFNITAYYEKFKNFQTQAVQLNNDGTTSFVLTNAPGIVSKGIQTDVSVRPVSDLSIWGMLAYNPTEYKNFQIPCYAGQPVTPGTGTGCHRVGTGTATAYDVSGFQAIYTSKWTLNAGFDYSPEISSNLRLVSNASYNYRSSQYTGTVGDPSTIVKGYGLLISTEK